MPESWSNFFIAEVGATAALTGLVIVAISINVGHILKHRLLPGRAAESVMVLGGALILCSLTLLPQPLRALGVEVLVLGAAIWLAPLTIQVRAWRTQTGDAVSPIGFRVLLGQATTLPAIVAEIVLLQGQADGLYWLAAGVLMALVSGVTHAWVLLVEILR